jgi:alkanesulfonate monooxygenase SsuD/methylene tetrahydromethanopterin reductase-like flavin-dependent oxidoreductase (luciferase family)
VALRVAAGATERIKLATGICLVIQRDPITTARDVASLDQLPGGRFLFGVGAGWNREEIENHGTDFARRFGVMRERVEAMKAIWNPGGGRVPRRARRFRLHLVLAQAAPDAPTAGRGRRKRTQAA